MAGHTDIQQPQTVDGRPQRTNALPENIVGYHCAPIPQGLGYQSGLIAGRCAQIQNTLTGLRVQEIGVGMAFRDVTLHDLDMDWDVRPAARDDDLDKAVDWKRVTKAILAFVGESRFKLVESLAERVAELVVTRFAVPRVRVRVEKPGAVRYSATVGVEVVRTREDYVE